MKTKNILIAINLDEGLYNFRMELVEALLNMGHNVHLAMPFGEYRQMFEGMGCTVHDTPLDRRGMNPVKEAGLLKRYGDILNNVKADVALTYTIKPNIYLGWQCKWKNIPYITTITGLGTAVSGEGVLSSITKWMYKSALSEAKTVFFQNEENEELFRNLGIAGDKHEMMPGSGVNLERFKCLDFPETGEFLFISRIMKEKGIGEFMDAASQIKRDNPASVFRVLGFLEDEYEDKERFESLIKDGIIQYEGSVADVRPYIEKAQCIVHPSYYPEGMSNVCLEAAASGRCVITTNRPGCRDTVINGVSGFLVKEKDSGDLTAKLREFLALSLDERAKMGKEARKYMEDKFDRKIVTNRMIDAIERACQ